MTKEDIIKLIEADPWMMGILRTVDELHLPDWWIGAGFVRSKVWDTLHSYSRRTPVPDIDVIYFDPQDFSEDERQSESTAAEDRYQGLLKKRRADLHWSVTNQARMHLFHGHQPYQSSEDGLAHWVETATCVGVRLHRGKAILTAPHGIDDLVNLILRPTPGAYSDTKHFERRLTEKHWLEKWPQLKIVLD